MGQTPELRCGVSLDNGQVDEKRERRGQNKDGIITFVFSVHRTRGGAVRDLHSQCQPRDDQGLGPGKVTTGSTVTGRPSSGSGRLFVSRPLHPPSRLFHAVTLVQSWLPPLADSLTALRRLLYTRGCQTCCISEFH